MGQDTKGFALVTGASSGIGAKNERVSRPLEAQEDTNPGEERHA